MNGKVAEQRGLKPLGIFKGFAVAGCEPDEMGIGPVLCGAEAFEEGRGLRFPTSTCGN